MQRNTIRENIEIFIVTKNSTFRYQLLLWYTENKRNLTSQTHYTIVMADQAEEEQHQAARTEHGHASQSGEWSWLRLCQILLVACCGQMLCSRSAAGRHSAIDRQQFRFTCVSANAISDTRHGWQPVSTVHVEEGTNSEWLVLPFFSSLQSCLLPVFSVFSF